MARKTALKVAWTVALATHPRATWSDHPKARPVFQFISLLLGDHAVCNRLCDRFVPGGSQVLTHGRRVQIALAHQRGQRLAIGMGGLQFLHRHSQRLGQECVPVQVGLQVAMGLHLVGLLLGHDPFCDSLLDRSQIGLLARSLQLLDGDVQRLSQQGRFVDRAAGYAHWATAKAAEAESLVARAAPDRHLVGLLPGDRSLSNGPFERRRAGRFTGRLQFLDGDAQRVGQQLLVVDRAAKPAASPAAVGEGSLSQRSGPGRGSGDRLHLLCRHLYRVGDGDETEQRSAAKDQRQGQSPKKGYRQCLVLEHCTLLEWFGSLGLGWNVRGFTLAFGSRSLLSS